MKIAVMGSGSWGLAMAKHLHSEGHQVTVWSFLEEEARMLREKRCNEALLPGVVLDGEIEITTQVEFVRDCRIVVMATPSYGVAGLARRLKPYMTVAHTAVILSKGFDKDGGYCLFSETLDKAWDRKVPLVAVTGPSHAEEVARGIPTAVVAASGYSTAALLVQQAFMSETLRVYTSSDIVGAELGGAMKNIMALAVGISDGYGFGDNTKAMLMTRGIAEMSRLGVWLGGKAETFSGLSGVGDLIVTCISQHSRNRRAGLLIGGGMPVEKALEKVGAVVEGYYATQAVHALVQGKVELPICNAIYQLLFENVSIQEAAKQLVTRGGRPESDLDLGETRDLSPMCLTTPRTRLVPLEEVHAEAFARAFDEGVSRYLELKLDDTEEVRTFIAECRQGAVKGEYLALAVLDKETNEFLGSVELDEITSQSPCLGVWIKKEAQGRGYATEAVGEVIAFAGQQFSIQCIVYRTDAQNTASIAAVTAWGGVLSEVPGQRHGPEGRALLEYRICIPGDI